VEVTDSGSIVDQPKENVETDSINIENKNDIEVQYKVETI